MADYDTGKTSTFGRDLMQYISSRMPYSGLNTASVTDQLNPKYKYFEETGERRAEALAHHSVSQNFDYNKDSVAAITSDKQYNQVMYANIQKDKLARVKDYRIMAAFAEVGNALDEICDEVINMDSNSGSCLKMNLVDTKLTEHQLISVNKEFSKYASYFDLEHRGWAYFRQLLTEGEIYWEHIIHEKYQSEGILGVVQVPTELVDPVFSNVQNVFVKGYLYRKPIFDKNNPLKQIDVQYVPLDKNQVTYVHSHVWNESKTMRVPFLENCRRAYRQLTMIEDTIIIYRLARAPERLVFNVDVGNMPGPKAEAYLRKLVSQYWSSKTYDPSAGGLVQKFNPQSILDNFWFAKRAGSEGTSVTQLAGGCFAMDTKVPLLDGRTLTISEIEEELKQKEVWIYSCDPKTGKIKPGLVSWAGVTQESADVMKITLDNGKEIICTLDHKFPILDKGFVEAKDLIIGESMIPLYRKNTPIKKGGNEYEMIYQNDTKTWEYTHRNSFKFAKDSGISKEMVHVEDYKNEKKNVIHHIDHNRFNNSPCNLAEMNAKDHFIYHSDIGFPVGVGTNASQLDKKNRIKKAKLGINKYFNNLSESEKQHRADISRENFKKGTIAFSNKLKTDKDFAEKISKSRSSTIKSFFDKIKKEGSYDDHMTNKFDKITKNSNYIQAIRNNQQNQTLVFDKSILDFVSKLCKGKTRFEITREDICRELNNSPLLEHFLYLNKDKNIRNWDRSGFAPTHFKPMAKQFGYRNWNHFRNEIDLYNHKIVNIEYLKDSIQVGTLTIDNEEKYHNYHTFALDAGVFTKNSNLGQLDDLFYFVKKLYQSLKVPTTRLDPQDAFRDGADMLREELKFAKFIIRMQQTFSEGLKNGFMTHLQLKGMWKEYNLKEQNLHIEFNVPTNFYELRESQKLELKTNTFANIASQESVSPTYAQKRYLGWTDIEIKANREFLRKDKAFRWELSQIEQFGPSWREMAQQQAEGMGADGGPEGMAGGSGGGGGSSMPPPFTGGPAATGPEAGEAEPPAGTTTASPEANATPETPPATA